MSLINPIRLSACVRVAAQVAAPGLVLLGACTVQAGLYAPPAPRVYAQPPAVSAAVETPGYGIVLTASEPPPPLPIYVQPPCPEDGYLWTPGYWQFANGGYFWVPGTWVQPPQVGVLWTPGYWGYGAGVYGFHAGYWGPTIGFYGGVNYGFGYGGAGFVGGRWDGGHYAYNTAVNNVNVSTIHNTYNQTVINTVTVNNGGSGGTVAVATPQERVAAQQPHIPPTSAQSAHILTASRNPALSTKVNGGHPAIAATPRPGAFSGPGVVSAKGAAPPPAKPAEAMAAPKSAEPATATIREPAAGNPAARDEHEMNAGRAAPAPAAAMAAHTPVEARQVPQPPAAPKVAKANAQQPKAKPEARDSHAKPVSQKNEKKEEKKRDHEGG
jgi:hypothetical protein